MIARTIGLMIAAISCFCSTWASAQPRDDASPTFRTHLLNAESEFGSAAAIDVNQDGKLDVVSGENWYEISSGKKHLFREVEQIRGRFDDYSNLTMDVDRDGDLDLISVNYRSQSLYWCKNPGPAKLDELWQRVVIDTPGASETGRLVDIDGDGQLDVLPNGTSFASWYELLPKQPDVAPKFARHDLPQEVMGHGIGAGDLNRDGRVDIISPRGWLEAPKDPRKDRWLWHPEFELGRDAGLPILVWDVDQDGDNDLIWARGHNIGLYWTEQVEPERSNVSAADDLSAADLDLVRARVERNKWLTHAIDTSWSSCHTLMLADIDGDGRDDLVAGKRFQGHDGRDPGENDPLCVYWYRFRVATKTWQRFQVSLGGTCGIDLDSKCVDLDGDGDIDILAPARCGLHWIENLGKNSSTENAASAAPPEYKEHNDFSYYLADGVRQPLATALDHGHRRQQILRQMEVVMGSFPSTDRRIPIQVRIDKVEPQEKYDRVHLTYQSEQDEQRSFPPVPAYLLLPKNDDKPRPAMLCLHPTHFELGKAQLIGLGGQASRHYAHELAELGFVCLVPDYPGFAEYQYDFAAHANRYASGTMKAVWDNVRGIDLLEALPCVDRDHIGVIGHSLGGHNSLYTAAFDQRLRCVVTSCGFNAFEDYYSGNLAGWTSDRYMPRIKTLFENDPRKMPFDFPEVLAAIAPRGLFVNAPLHDENFAVVGVRKCEAAVRPLYDLLKVKAKAIFEYPDAAHDFPQETRDQAYRWLEEQSRIK